MKAELLFLNKRKTDGKEAGKNGKAVRVAVKGVSHNSCVCFFTDEFPKAACKNAFEEDLSLILP